MSDTSSRDDADGVPTGRHTVEPAPSSGHVRAKPGPLGALARVAFRRRGRVVVAWLLALGLAVGLSVAFAGDFSADYSAPGSDSDRAVDLLDDRFPDLSGATIDVLVRAEDGVADPAVRQDVTTLLDDLSAKSFVAGMDDPYATPGAISADGSTLRASLRLEVVNPAEAPPEETGQLLAIADDTSRPGLDVALGGEAVQFAEQSEIGSEGIAMVAAALILLLTFGSVVAAGLPIAVALAGLAVSGVLTGVIAGLTEVPDWSTALATMLGIALGIDYTLLMVTRFREWRATGLDTASATVATVDTAGRSVLVAGTTVVVSMLGLFAMGLSFMRGAALVTIVAVLIVMVAAVTLFPALLGYLGRWIDRLRLPLGRPHTAEVSADGHIEPHRGWVGWSRLVERHSLIAVAAGVAILLALAAPFLGVRFGFPDSGNEAAEKSGRQAYDLTADAFGPGANGPLVLVGDLSDVSDPGVVERLTEAVSTTPGVAGVTPPQLDEGNDAVMLMVIPETGPQDEATEDLVRTLRDDVIPAATDGSGAQLHVGGAPALSIDSMTNIAERLPYLIGGVVGLSLLLLLVAFRSILIPLTAAAMNLLSVGAAYGVMTLVLDGGWFGELVGIDTEAPMPAFIPVLVFAVLFGLSMDYEVFLISRMRESWTRTGDNARAVLDGLAGTGRVITAAAAIMVAVFAAFIPSPDLMLKVIGVGMAAAILIDATVVRMLLVPAIMHLLGRANWWLPAWLDRRLPRLYVEGRPERHLPPAPAGNGDTSGDTDGDTSGDTSGDTDGDTSRDTSRGGGDDEPARTPTPVG